MGEVVGVNLAVAIRGGAMESFVPVFSGTLEVLDAKMQLVQSAETKRN